MVMKGISVCFVTFPLSISAFCEPGFVEVTSIEAYINSGRDLSLDFMDCLPETTECLPFNTTVTCEENILYCKPSMLEYHDFLFIRPPRKCTFANGSKVCVEPKSCLMAYIVVSPTIYSYGRIKWVPLTVVSSILFCLALGYLYLQHSDKDVSINVT